MPNRLQVTRYLLKFIRYLTCVYSFSIIAKKMGLPWRDFNKFANLQQKLNISLQDFDQLIDKFLGIKSYSRESIMAELEISDTEFEQIFLTQNTMNCEVFKLKRRAQHVIQGTILHLNAFCYFKQ